MSASRQDIAQAVFYLRQLARIDDGGPHSADILALADRVNGLQREGEKIQGAARRLVIAAKAWVRATTTEWLVIVNGDAPYFATAASAAEASADACDAWRRTFTPDTPEESGGAIYSVRAIRWDSIRRVPSEWPTDARRAVDELADAIDAFDPMLGESTD